MIGLISGLITPSQIKFADTPEPQTIKDGTIYVYSGLEDKVNGINKHAEQYHCDIIKSILDTLPSDQKMGKIYIAGVKRPCQTCHGSLTTLNEALKKTRTDAEIIFGQSPGNLWPIQGLIQTEKAVMCTCDKIIEENAFHVTLSEDETQVPNFDTDSDSGGDNDSELDSISAPNKKRKLETSS